MNAILRVLHWFFFTHHFCALKTQRLSPPQKYSVSQKLAVSCLHKNVEADGLHPCKSTEQLYLEVRTSNSWTFLSWRLPIDCDLLADLNLAGDSKLSSQLSAVQQTFMAPNCLTAATAKRFYKN